MCGIAGKIVKTKITPEQIKAMTDLMVRRGPEAEGIEIFADKDFNVGFGHRRLKIVDLSDEANQPFISPDRQIYILFNGEIYNFRELKKQYLADEVFRTTGDTEVILKLYEKFGLDFVSKLRGMFAIALYDLRDSVFYLIRDRLGKKPLFYYHRQDTLIFGSQLNTILTQPEVKKELDLAILDDYLSFNYVPTNNSVFKNIYKLPPATILKFRKGNISLQKYWKLSYLPKISVSEENALSQTEDLLQESVRLRMIADVPLGAFLSGGIDSGLIVALMSRQTAKVKTFSIGFEQQDFSELQYARLVADKYNTDHTEFIVKPEAVNVIPELIASYDEPYADPSQIPMDYLAKLTRAKVTVALNGDGGDECFAGYERYLGLLYQQYYRLIPAGLRRALQALLTRLPENTAHRSLLRRFKWLNKISLTAESAAYLQTYRSFDPKLKKQVYGPEMLSVLGQGGGDREFMDYFEAVDGSLVDKMLSTDINTYLPQDLLVKADRSTMAHSLEGRSPLLDHKLMEFTARLPVNLKIKNFKTKYLLKKLAVKFLPAQIINRPKQGFGVPLGSWFRKELQGYTAGLFAESRLVQDHLLNADGLNSILQAHLSGKANHGRRLFTLVMLENWYRKNL